jgi:hypothetical protein
MVNIGLSLIEALILLSLATTVASLFAAIGGLIRYTTRAPGSAVSVFWLVRVGVFAGVPFGIVGVTSGYLTGLSRVSAVSALVPAALTLVGGVAVYLLGKGGKPALLAAFAAVDFSVLMLIGALIGARERDDPNGLLDAEILKLKRELVIEQYRNSWSLPEKPSKREDEETNSE